MTLDVLLSAMYLSDYKYIETLNISVTKLMPLSRQMSLEKSEFVPYNNSGDILPDN